MPTSMQMSYAIVGHGWAAEMRLLGEVPSTPEALPPACYVSPSRCFEPCSSG
jgi:hypothetical protein